MTVPLIRYVMNLRARSKANSVYMYNIIKHVTGSATGYKISPACRDVAIRSGINASKFHRQKEISSPAEIYTEHKYLRLSLKVHSPKEPAGFVK